MGVLVHCDYADCENEYPIDEMEEWDDGEFKWHACPTCSEKIENITGYCGVGCLFGHGCDQSC